MNVFRRYSNIRAPASSSLYFRAAIIAIPAFAAGTFQPT